MEDTTKNLSEENINSMEEEMPSDTPHKHFMEKLQSKKLEINKEQRDLINQAIQQNYQLFQQGQNYQITQKNGTPIIQEERLSYQIYQPKQINQSYQLEQGGAIYQPVQNYQMIHTTVANEVIKQPYQNYPNSTGYLEHHNVYEYQDNNEDNQNYNLDYYQINQSDKLLGNQVTNYNKMKIPMLRQNIHKISQNNGASVDIKKKKRKKKNSGPKDSLSKLFIKPKEDDNNRNCVTSRGEKESIDGRQNLISFQEISSKKISKSKLNMENGNFTGFVEIPREEYLKNADKETFFLEKGMNTGKYTFRGKETIIKEDDVPGGRVKITEKDITDELIRRKNKQNRKVRYEICDKFYTLFEFNRESKNKQDISKNDKGDKDGKGKDNESGPQKSNNFSNNLNFNGPKNIANNLNSAGNNNLPNNLNSAGNNIIQNNFSSKGNNNIQNNLNLNEQKHFPNNLNSKGNGGIQNSFNLNEQKNFVNNINFKGNSNLSMKCQISPMKSQQENEKCGNNSSYTNFRSYNYGSSFIYNNYELSSLFPKDDFSKSVLEQINRIRIDPQSFIGTIERGKENIIQCRNGTSIYKGKSKIALSQGTLAFNRAIAVLRNTESMQKLTFSPQLTVELPKDETEIKDKNDLKEKVEDMIREGINIRSYWRDIIKDPETCVLLMIVDDTGINSGMRRNDILNPKMKYIGISSVEINGHFVCYLTLSTSLYY